MTVFDAGWMQAYGRQADADLRAHELYASHPLAVSTEAHSLLFLQMACEKACKAYLIRGGENPQTLQSSHAKIAGPLPAIRRRRMLNSGRDPHAIEGLLTRFRHIARQIELLNPAVDDSGKRPDNCEYPWVFGQKITSPLDYQFEVSRLVVQPAGVTFRKMLRQAIDDILE